MLRFEPVLDEQRPDALLVVGDVNSTIACALVAVKKGIPIVHVEAGLRSGDRGMPEEINRILTDQISDLLFTTERSALDNLSREGIDADKVVFAGNVMIDTLLYNLSAAVPAADTLGAATEPGATQKAHGGYGLLTLHRPSNVDTPDTLARLVNVLTAISAELPLVFPVHPRTHARLAEAGLDTTLAAAPITLLPPQGYREMLGLMREAKAVFTDSGGIQEETTALGVPCITLRESTERPITVESGTNVVVGTDPGAIREAWSAVRDGRGTSGRQPEGWDGHAAERIVQALRERL